MNTTAKIVALVFHRRPMNELNRLLAVILLLVIGLFSLGLFLTFTSVVEVTELHFSGQLKAPYLPFRNLVLAVTNAADLPGRYYWEWLLGSLVVFLITILLLVLELRGTRPPSAMLLHQNESGRTVLFLGALTDLARWTGEDTSGVEEMPSIRVRFHRGRVYVRGRALLNPFVNARATVPLLQERLRAALERATGFPVHVQLTSSFQKPEVRRRPR